MRQLKNPRSGEMNVALKQDWQLLPLLRDMVIEDQDEFAQTLGDIDSYTPSGFAPSYTTKDTANMLCAARSVYQVTRLWEKRNVTYDAVVYLRPDLGFLDLINIGDLVRQHPVNSTHPNWWVTPNQATWFGVNDRFALGSPGIMSKYGRRQYYLRNYTASKPLHSEMYLKFAMQSQGVAMPEERFYRMIRVRSHSSLFVVVTPDVKQLAWWEMDNHTLTEVDLPGAWKIANDAERNWIKKRKFVRPRARR
eukprot:Hpha_TRINITY_DN9242_c0_g1::TRINITY_DN9242_c0_g1_i1::g.28572::m.28572